jgi:hypothetical protein
MLLNSFYKRLGLWGGGGVGHMGKVLLVSHTNKCTNYIIYYLKSVTLKHSHSSYMFRHIVCHPQGALMVLAKITCKNMNIT